MWLDRLIDRIRISRGSEQERRVAAVIARRGTFEGNDRFFEAVVQSVDGDDELTEATLARIVRALRESSPLPGDDLATEVDFWARLARRFARNAQLAAYQGDSMILDGREAEGLAVLLEALDRAPALITDFLDHDEPARRVGGMLGLRYRVAWLKAYLDADFDSGDETRELYSELLDQYGDDPAALELLRPVGERIRGLEEAGDLPRAMVRRTRSRRRD
jgi:hypothetical protein